MTMEDKVDIIKCLERAVQSCQIDVVREHLLKDVLPVEDFEVPFILISKSSDSDNSKSPASDVDTSKTSSLGGSPLKLTEYYVGRSGVSCSKTGATYKPCCISDARKLLSVYQLQCQEENICHPVMPLWVLCDEEDPHHTVAISSHVRKSEDKYIFKSHVVTVTGPHSEMEVTSKLITVLKNISNQSNGNSKRVDVQCSAIYNVFGALGSRDVSLDQIQSASSTMNLNLTWSKLSLSMVPPRDAKALVKVTAVAGDERSAAYSRHRELNILLELVRGVEKNEVHLASENSDVTPLVRVAKLLDDMKTGNISSLGDEGDTSDSPAPVTLTSTTRKDLDFTEQLWSILKDCTSNRELVECLKSIFNCLKSGQIQPMVHRTNKTTVAELVRESFHNKMTAPTLDGAGAVNLLIDLGIEKITRDYISNFVGQELVTLKHLTPFMTNNRDLSLTERAKRLDKLHHALELAVLLDQFVHVPHATLSLCARQALEYYEQNDTEPHHEFTIPLQTSVVTGYIENCKPCDYQVSFTRHHGDYKSHSVVQLSTQPLLSLNSVSLSESCSEEEQCNYYLTTVTENLSCL